MVPAIIAAGAGAGAAWLRKSDVDHARTQLSKQFGTWAELGLAASGLIAGNLRLNIASETIDALTYSGLALSGERVARSALSGTFGTGAPAMIPRGFGSDRVYASYPGGGAAFATKGPSLTIY
jgi:hypothetical protein